MHKCVLFEQLIIILDNFRFKKQTQKSIYNWIHITEIFLNPAPKKLHILLSSSKNDTVLQFIKSLNP
jgi:hypothetical protein